MFWDAPWVPQKVFILFFCFVLNFHPYGFILSKHTFTLTGSIAFPHTHPTHARTDLRYTPPLLLGCGISFFFFFFFNYCFVALVFLSYNYFVVISMQDNKKKKNRDLKKKGIVIINPINKSSPPNSKHNKQCNENHLRYC